MDNSPHSIQKLNTEVADLKSDIRLAAFKMDRTDEAISDIKELLQQLSNIHTEQSLIQHDIVTIYKKVAAIQESTEDALKQYAPLKEELTSNVSAFKSGLRVMVFAFAILQGIIGWGLGQAYTTIKDLNSRVETLTVNYRVLDNRYKNLEHTLNVLYKQKPPDGFED